MATIKLPEITPFPTKDVDLQKLVEQLKLLKEKIEQELQRLENNKQDA